MMGHRALSKISIPRLFILKITKMVIDVNSILLLFELFNEFDEYTFKSVDFISYKTVNFHSKIQVFNWS